MKYICVSISLHIYSYFCNCKFKTQACENFLQVKISKNTSSDFFFKFSHFILQVLTFCNIFTFIQKVHQTLLKTKTSTVPSLLVVTFGGGTMHPHAVRDWIIDWITDWITGGFFKEFSEVAALVWRLLSAKIN